MIEPLTFTKHGRKNISAFEVNMHSTLGTHLDGDHNNNRMERLNGEILDREKTMCNVKRVDTPALEGLQLIP